MRPTTQMEKRFDERYVKNSGFWHSLAVRVFRRHINRVASVALNRAYERGQINSEQLHAVSAIVDRMIYPRLDYDGCAYQENNIAGGDIAGRDINK